MTHRALTTWLATAWLCCASGCSPKTPDAVCVKSPPTASVIVAPDAPAASAPNVAGTWLFTCCDGASTWQGMLALVNESGALHGVWITDGDSHGSYLEGRVEGNRVQLWRRWLTGSTRHEQAYELELDPSGQHLNGRFREPAFDPAAHSIQLVRGFVVAPRSAPPAPSAVQVAAPARDPNRPCDCKLVCYCGGVPPGREHYEEAARCGPSCKCAVCPPLP